MIGLTAMIVIGIIFKIKSAFILPIAYLVEKRNKDLGILVFFAYSIALGYELTVSNILSYEAAQITFLVVMSSLIALDEILKGVKAPKTRDWIIISILILGFFLEKLLIFGLIAYILSEVLQNVTDAKSSIIRAFIVLAALVLLTTKWNYLVAPSEHIAVISAILLFILLLSTRESVKKVNAFTD